MKLDIDAYLGRPFDREHFNCWHLASAAWLELTGQRLDEARWERLERPRSPCLVYMARRRAIPHVGLFWRGRVLHIHPTGTRFERLPDATRGFSQVSFHACSTSF